MLREQRKISDPTNHNLSAALLDQKVAGLFHDQIYAYTVVTVEELPKLWSLGIAVANEDGFNPILSSEFNWDDFDQASSFVEGMNLHIGLKERDAIEIVVSTMGGRRY